MFDQLTDTELDQLASKLHHGTVNFFDTVTAMHAAMSQMSTWTPEYEAIAVRADRMLAAGSESSKIFAEVTGAIRCRLAA